MNSLMKAKETKRMPRMLAITAVAVFAVLCLALCGCGSSSNSSKESIGSNSNGAVAAQLTNGTGKSIASIQYKASNDAAWSGNMITAGQSLADKAKVTAYFQVGSDTAANWDIQITTSDGMVATAMRIPLASVKELTIGLDGNTAIVDYVDASGNKVDGKAHAQEVEKAMQEEAAAAEEAAASSAVASAAAPSQNYDSAEEPDSEPSESGADYSADTSTGQEQQGCLR